ncbi:MAG: DUF2339 domain-containing protein [Betaproteobacteria bacterium]
MLALIGLVLGAWLGHFFWTEWGAALGGFAGFFAGALVSSRRQRDAFRKPSPAATTAIPTRAPDSAAPQPIDTRLALLERRVAMLEAQACGESTGAGMPPADPAVAPATAVASPRGDDEHVVPPLPVMTPPPSSSPLAVTGREQGDTHANSPAAPDARAAMSQAAAVDSSAPSSSVPVARAPGEAPSFQPSAAGSKTLAQSPPTGTHNALWAWFTGGNAMTRIGVVVLFFGVAFLLRYFAEHFTIPIEARLAGVALAGVLLIAVGWRVARTRPAYGASLQGAGTGVLYLTTFAAFHRFGVLDALPAFALLAAIAALTVWLALVADAQALAGLALGGAFLAPMLSGVHRDPLPLFGYFAVVNVAVLAMAWARTWRAVNLLGFAFTFVLALFWGNTYYRPEHLRTVEPFLVLSFLQYVGVAILQARRLGPRPAQPVDGLLIFGVPLVGFALQAALLRDTRYGAAWSALAIAGVYGVLMLPLRRSGDAGWSLLARLFGALAVIFATLAIAFAFDPRWTAAAWSIEAALVFWLGIQQRTVAGRGFALVLDVAAGIIFVLAGVAGDDDRLFLNAFFTGTLLVAMAGFATAWLADRNTEVLSRRERTLLPLMFGWAALWWLAGGDAELLRQLPRSEVAHAVLAWMAGSAGLALLMRRPLGWPRLGWLGAVVLPTMVLVAMRDLEGSHTTLLQAGWLLWPLAWGVHVWALRINDEDVTAIPSSGLPVRPAWREGLHAVSALAITAHIAWEASEWVGRVTAADTAWVACAAALPGIVYLWLVPRWCDSRRWPFHPHGRAYLVAAGAPMAALLLLWGVGVNVLSPGEPYPLPYAPLINPLDLTLSLMLWAVFQWSRRHPALDERTRFAGLGLGIFLSINGGILRAAHHWGSIPWDLSALLQSRPLQATLTLAWTITGVALMFGAARRRVRPLWMVGAALLALVLAKLFLVDLNTLSGLPRVVAFLGVGSLLLLIGYLSPLPPSAREERVS